MDGLTLWRSSLEIMLFWKVNVPKSMTNKIKTNSTQYQNPGSEFSIPIAHYQKGVIYVSMIVRLAGCVQK